MDKIKILWADDEIDLLKPQLIFLEQKGYEVTSVSNGYDALEIIEADSDYDAVFLDESMPGISGLETLERIKSGNPMIPVVMITKNEEEHIMEQAIGSQIADYLIKPVNPNQILLTLKKITDEKRLVRQKSASDYQQQFRQIFMAINSGMNYEEWIDIYKQIIKWELKLDETNASQMSEILSSQKSDANAEFSKFVSRNYFDWMKYHAGAGPVMSYNVLREYVFPHMVDDIPNLVVLLDNLRYDQWKILEPIISDLFKVESEDTFYSILPTSTQYSRNAIFAGMTPYEISQKFPDLWKNDVDDGGKNLYEADFLNELIKRTFRKEIKTEYIKVTNNQHGKNLVDNVLNLCNNNLSVIVYNFIDMLSHARTEMEVLKELAADEKAYRSLTRSWFLHSPLWAALEKLAERDIRLFILTDHGTIRVKTPSKVIGDRETTTNLRYKAGRNLQYDPKDVLDIKDPIKGGLPKPNVSSSFIFATEDKYFLYPNNYNYYNNYYRDTFQHGGISLEEMICPCIRLRSK
jgi:CheY-like chemotaxis protein